MLKIISKPQPDCLHQAGQHACKLLLNCYIREWRDQRPQQIVVDEAAMAAVIRFPHSGMIVKAELAYYSAVGEHEYASLLWSGDGSTEKVSTETAYQLPTESSWIDEATSGKYVPAQESAFFLTHQSADADEQPSLLSHDQLLRWMIAELSAAQNIEVDAVQQFMSRVDNSMRNMALYMQHAQRKQNEVHDYRTSEQGLVCGHPFHPFPKSTVGFHSEDKQRFSPELGASFQLCYMAVHRDYYSKEWVDEQTEIQFTQALETRLQDVLRTQSDRIADDYALLPMHPWQYEHVQQLLDVQQYIKQRLLIPLGAAGPLAYPTSSVRTVYVPDMNCNMKLPLNIQITNLTRNNSQEQMQRTLEAARYVLDRDGFADEQGTHIAYEKGIGTCTFIDEQITCLFTVAYRPITFDPACTYVLSSLVESHVPGGMSRLVKMLEEQVQKQESAEAEAEHHPSQMLIQQAERWLQKYLELSLLPIVRIAEREGIHFEAHLQNTLVTLHEGMPKQFILRDLEGVSVEEQHGRQHLLQSKQPQYLFYDQQSARNRTTYYFIVNHLGSLLHVLARDTGCREQHYWRIAQAVLKREVEQTGNSFADYLLQADAFLAKQNLRSCLQGHGDTPDYVYVTNQLKSTEGVSTMGTSGVVATLPDQQWTAYIQVQERIMRQTLEALWFEGIVSYECEGERWTTDGTTADGQNVVYSCIAEQKASFGRVKIQSGTLQRNGEPCTDLYVFLEEVVHHRLEGERVSHFIQELLETLAKDSQCRAQLPACIPAEDRHYDALESHMTDGHPYHPSYKSRLGFSLRDNAAYGPEFNADVQLFWVAARREWADTALSQGVSYEQLLDQHLTAEDRNRFEQFIMDTGNPVDAYVLLPVHPWQWEHQIQSVFSGQLSRQELIALGNSDTPYRAQQSIRSLSNRHQSYAPYIKLALHMTNTSTSRILAHHTTQNAPLISDWLEHLIQQDAYLQQLDFDILKEIMGVSFRYAELPKLQYSSAYGSLGTIWRENINTKLHEGEEAWPLNAVSLIQPNGEPFCAKGIAKHGVQMWSRELVRVVVLPIVHLLYGHGIALESHAQNIILVLEQGLPKRIIVKDLHDGVRYVPDQLLHPEWAPELHPIPETHRKFNRYSFIHAETTEEVRDYTYDAFFFICVTELALTIERFGLPEREFWKLCADTIGDYQQQHPQYRERFADYDLFAPGSLIEEMTKRRLYGDSELYFRSVSNPLRQARDGQWS